MSGIEIERKFLVRGEDYRQQAESNSRIKQGYIGCNTCSVRVRIRDNRGFLTIKGPSKNGGLSRYEFEKEISLVEAQHLMELCDPGIIDKTRYLVRCGNHVFEVDEFYGDNAGLVIAEVELSHEDEKFDKPDFIGDEVTGDRRFHNSYLRAMPFIVWRGTIPKAYRHIALE